ncbi:MAG: DUF4097 family beta strand repeat-containing protein [Acidobacteriota bacterium]
MTAKKHRLLPAFILVLFLCASPSISWERFEKTYKAKERSHLTISNIRGQVMVAAWNKKIISVRAETDPSVEVDDEVSKEEIEITVKKEARLGRADFEIFAPANTSISIKNIVGKIEVRGISGHVSVKSFDSDVRLTGIRAPSVDVRITGGDIYFDGELQEDGDYSFQSMKGDIEMSLPASSRFRLKARALSENINLGEFLSNFREMVKGSKEISGSYRDDGPKLSVTTYAGRILFHKK